jgi:predicted dehydrogenase
MHTRIINVAIVGLRFGAEFIPIYQNHPNTKLCAICDVSQEKLDQIGELYGVDQRYTSFEQLLEDSQIDAVHIVSPIDLHASQSIAALKKGKHVACAVPMARTIEECSQIIEAQRTTGKNYMMMETAVYSREFLYVKELRDTGKLGRLQFLRGSHHQEMANWPEYWQGLPPMHYATHAIGPILALAQKETDFVSCLGSGKIADSLAAKYGSPFAVETALLRLRESDLSAEITRSLFETSRQYMESFDVYGEKMSFEWSQLAGEESVIFTGERGQRLQIPDYAHLLPESIQPFTTKGMYERDGISYQVSGGHGGSHPHLVNEFIMSLVNVRSPFPDARQSANWTCTGICAHESAMNNGEIVKLPVFI